jgi:hypothetical protein
VEFNFFSISTARRYLCTGWRSVKQKVSFCVGLQLCHRENCFENVEVINVDLSSSVAVTVNILKSPYLSYMETVLPSEHVLMSSCTLLSYYSPAVPRVCTVLLHISLGKWLTCIWEVPTSPVSCSTDWTVLSWLKCIVFISHSRQNTGKIYSITGL